MVRSEGCHTMVVEVMMVEVLEVMEVMEVMVLEVEWW